MDLWVYEKSGLFLVGLSGPKFSYSKTSRMVKISRRVTRREILAKKSCEEIKIREVITSAKEIKDTDQGKIS